MTRPRVVAIVVALLALTAPLAAQRPTTATVSVRGQPQSLHVYGTRGAQPVIVSSGDGGWIHLAPHIAEALAARGFFVVGFDAKAYLSSFTSRDSTLAPSDVPGDYRAVIDFAAPGSSSPPVLIGVSEGAGLSVLAATSGEVKGKVKGVVAVGLPEKNELAWRWRDSLIYLTHGVPNEPLFSSTAIIDRVAPVPLAVIHSTTDEFVPLEQLRQMFGRAGEPKRLWVVKASDHGFSDNLAEFDARLVEALAWLAHPAPTS